jgi:transcription antitermination factor NusG
LASDLGEWLVARVKARQEKALARVLMEYGIAYYLPVACKRHLRPDNGYPKRAWIPIFPGYVAFVGRANRSIVARTNRILGVLLVPDQDGFVRELEAVQQILASGLPCEASADLLVGASVWITAGPLKGLRGVVEAVQGGHALLVRVDMFQQSIRTLLPTGYIERPFSVTETSPIMTSVPSPGLPP